MILDTAKITLLDGSWARAIDVFPGRGILSFRNGRATSAQVLDRKIAMCPDAIGLLLSNGKKLSGSRDQVVCVCREKQTRFTTLDEVEMGDKLRGETAGMPTTVDVIGLLFYPKTDLRLVSFRLDHEKSFVAEGVLCR